MLVRKSNYKKEKYFHNITQRTIRHCRSRVLYRVTLQGTQSVFFCPMSGNVRAALIAQLRRERQEVTARLNIYLK